MTLKDYAIDVGFKWNTAIWSNWLMTARDAEYKARKDK